MANATVYAAPDGPDMHNCPTGSNLSGYQSPLRGDAMDSEGRASPGGPTGNGPQADGSLADASPGQKGTWVPCTVIASDEGVHDPLFNPPGLDLSSYVAGAAAQWPLCLPVEELNDVEDGLEAEFAELAAQGNGDEEEDYSDPSEAVCIIAFSRAVIIYMALRSAFNVCTQLSRALTLVTGIGHVRMCNVVLPMPKDVQDVERIVDRALAILTKPSGDDDGPAVGGRPRGGAVEVTDAQLRAAVAEAGGAAFGADVAHTVWAELADQMANTLAGHLDKDKAAPRKGTVRWYVANASNPVAEGSTLTVRQACYFIAYHKLASKSTVRGVDMLCGFLSKGGLLPPSNMVPR